MGRNVNSLEPKLVAKIERDLKKGTLQKTLARRYGLNLRWISEIAVAMRKRERAEEEKNSPKPIIGDTDAAPDRSLEELDYQERLRKKLRKLVPINQRAKAIADLLESPNAQLKKAGLDQLNLIEGVSKNKERPYEPGPLFIIDTIPGLNPPQRRTNAEEAAAITPDDVLQQE